MNLQGKTVLLTGASGGIGQAIARRLARQGARLILPGRNLPALSQLAGQLGQPAANHCSLQIDLAAPSGVTELVDFCRNLPEGIDVLINNAGVCDFSLLDDLDAAAIQRLISINLCTPMLLCNSLLPVLRQREQAIIVNIGSVLGAIGNPGFTTYCASKAGLARFSEALRRELVDSRVRVIHFNPRATATEMNSHAVASMNSLLRVATDPAERVAIELLDRINNDRFGESSLGWAENLYIRINSLLPRLVDKAFARNLPIIKQYARKERMTSVPVAEHQT